MSDTFVPEMLKRFPLTVIIFTGVMLTAGSAYSQFVLTLSRACLPCSPVQWRGAIMTATADRASYFQDPKAQRVFPPFGLA